MYLKIVLLLLPSALPSPLKNSSLIPAFSNPHALVWLRVASIKSTGKTQEQSWSTQWECKDKSLPRSEAEDTVVSSPAICHFRVSAFSFHVNLWLRTSLKSHLTSHFSSSFILCIKRKSNWKIWGKGKHCKLKNALLMKRKWHTDMTAGNCGNGGKWNPWDIPLQCSVAILHISLQIKALLYSVSQKFLTDNG